MSLPIEDDTMGTKEEDFSAFYYKFHTDSIFQVERTQFPLEGWKFIDSIDTSVDYNWQAENWRFQRLIDFDTSSLEQTLIQNLDIQIEEFICSQHILCQQRKFMRTQDGWQLTFYADFGIMSLEEDAELPIGEEE